MFVAATPFDHTQQKRRAGDDHLKTNVRAEAEVASRLSTTLSSPVLDFELVLNDFAPGKLELTSMY